jgi:hypothetical protein
LGSLNETFLYFRTFSKVSPILDIILFAIFFQNISDRYKFECLHQEEEEEEKEEDMAALVTIKCHYEGVDMKTFKC